MYTQRLSQIGNSLGVILPREVVARMHLAKGDPIHITEAANGGFTLSPYDPAIEEELAMGQAFMNEYRETFKVLAK